MPDSIGTPNRACHFFVVLYDRKIASWNRVHSGPGQSEYRFERCDTGGPAIAEMIINPSVQTDTAVAKTPRTTQVTTSDLGI